MVIAVEDLACRYICRPILASAYSERPPSDDIYGGPIEEHGVSSALHCVSTLGHVGGWLIARPECVAIDDSAGGGFPVVGYSGEGNVLFTDLVQYQARVQAGE